MTAPTTRARTPLPLILCAWMVVTVPLAWGLYQSVVKSRPLFAPSPAPTAAPAAAPAK